MRIPARADAFVSLEATLDADPRWSDWRSHVRHEESLHPHDAVSVLAKGLPGGLTA
jgi:GTP cyclohydrolase I